MFSYKNYVEVNGMIISDHGEKLLNNTGKIS